MSDVSMSEGAHTMADTGVMIELKMQKYRLLNHLTLCLSLSALCACSARPRQHISESTAEVEFPRMLIKAGGEIKTAEELFEEGVDAFEAKRFAVCEDRLHTYLKHFSADLYTHSAHYNIGLCLELQGKHTRAAEHFRAYIDLSKEASDRRDGQIRLGYNMIFSGQHPEAIGLYTHLLTAEPIKGLDRAECHLRRAIAQAALGQYAEADQELNLAMSHTNSTLGPYRVGNEMLAEIYFQRGEVYRQHMRSIELKLPLTTMTRNVRDKQRFFQRSIYAFASCIKVKHAYWAIAAGHQVGALYEGFYHDLMRAEYPPEFDEETLAYYYFKLEGRLVSMLKEAIKFHEQTIILSQHQDLNNEWVDATHESLTRLRQLESELYHRLSLDEIEAHKHRQSTPPPQPSKRPPLPPRYLFEIGSSHEQSGTTNR